MVGVRREAGQALWKGSSVLARKNVGSVVGGWGLGCGYE